MSKQWKKYLLWFAQEHVDFRVSEIKALQSLFKIDMKYQQEPCNDEPFWIVELSSENDAKLIANRSVSLKSCIELWAHEKSIDNLHSTLKNECHLYTSHFEPTKSFKIEVETFCRHFTQQEKVEKIETFNYLPAKGPADLTNPDVCMQYIEYYGHKANDPPLLPYNVFFGRRIANGLRQLIKKLSLKTRKFIGNTSMDPQLSLLMANQAKVKTGDVVLDPFVGSGSLLVAAAHFGGYCYGSDIDFLMLHGKTKPTRIKQKQRGIDESIKANMKQYNLEHQYLDVLVSDFSMNIWRDAFEFDAIITDPPYGIREATEKIGSTRENPIIEEKYLDNHYPGKIEYGIPQIYKDLLIFASKHLRIGGRLVCWFPVFREDYTEDVLPSHSCLKLVANSEQPLSRVTARRLLTFEKTKHPVKDSHLEEDGTIQDFREKYFIAREESRKERRMKEAEVRKIGWIEYNLKNLNTSRNSDDKS